MRKVLVLIAWKAIEGSGYELVAVEEQGDNHPDPEHGNEVHLVEIQTPNVQTQQNHCQNPNCKDKYSYTANRHE